MPWNAPSRSRPRSRRASARHPRFRAYLDSSAFIASLPPEGQALTADILAVINTADWLAIGEKIDGNDDRILCLKQKPKTPGNLFGWVFNAVDNTSNHPAD